MSRVNLGEDTAARFCASRKAPDENALVQMVVDGGFADVEVHVQKLTVRLPRGKIRARPPRCDADRIERSRGCK